MKHKNNPDAARIEMDKLFGIEEIYVSKKKIMDIAAMQEGITPQTFREEVMRVNSGEADVVVSNNFEVEDTFGTKDAEIPAILDELKTKGRSKTKRLAELKEIVSKCQKCSLGSTRDQIVFGDGNPEAKLVFVGEAPGADEDASGLPFVGRAGKLLTKIIIAMGLRREDVFICNVLKCRPPENRNPAAGEVKLCSPVLHAQLDIIRPKAICTLGAPATKCLLGSTPAITEIRGRMFWYRGIPLMPTFHPAYLLRSPGQKRFVWDDMQKLRDYLNAD